MSRFEAFEKLCKEYVAGHQTQSLEEIYVLVPSTSPVEPTSLNRIGGPPLGIDEGSWPRYAQMAQLMGRNYDGETRMEHVFTLDLRQTPTLRRGLPPSVIAMSMFISSAKVAEVYVSRRDQAEIVFLTQEHVDAGYFSAELPERLQGQAVGFDIQPMMVPSAIFVAHHEDVALQTLHQMLFDLPGYAGGQEIWLQGELYEEEPYEGELYEGDDGLDDFDGSYDEDARELYDDDDYDPRSVEWLPEDDIADELNVGYIEPPVIPVSRMPTPIKLATGFLLQFGEGFAPIILGDSGRMYVYGGDAFWQCY